MAIGTGLAILGSALIGGASSAYGAKKSASAISGSTDASIRSQEGMYEQNREDLAPWREAGQNALNQLENPIENFYASPDYEFRRSEGLRDTGNMFNMKGGGGNAMKGITGYASNLASGEFGNWFNRTFAQSEAGRGATGTTAHLGANAANANSNAYMNQGNNLANIYNNNAANINNQVQGGISNYLYHQKTGNSNDWLQEVPYTPYRK